MKFETLLVCGAIEGEIDQFQKEGICHTLKCGVGNIQSALNVSVYLNQHPEIDSVLFLGSAGFYGDGELPHFGISHSFRYCELASLTGRVKTPEPAALEVETEKVELLGNWVQNLPEGKTNSVNSICIHDLSDEEKAGLKDRGLVFENMETLGISFVCKKHDLPFTACYAITNRVGSEGSLDWKSNWKKMSEILQDSLIEYFNQKYDF